MTQEEPEGLQGKVLGQFKAGKPLFGEDGVFAPLSKHFPEEALQTEVKEHLGSGKRLEGNKRNGKGRKTLKSGEGSMENQTPQDPHSTFDPQITKKRETIPADDLQGKIIGLYGLGMSLRDISNHIKAMYGTEISHTVLSQVIDRTIPEWDR